MQKAYKTNFLNNVILRIDFLNPLTEMPDELPAEINTKAREFFSIPEPSEDLGTQLQLSNAGSKTTDFKYKTWNYYGKNREKSLHISERFLSIEFKKYKDFEDLKNHYKEIFGVFFNKFKDLQISRIGLRYINEIELNKEKNPFAWKEYLNKDLLGNLNFMQDKTEISKIMSLIELNKDKFYLKFQCGMYNPDHPAVIKRKVFVLDYDASSQGLLTKDDIFDLLPLFHDEISKLFELSIKDKMRSMLNEQ